MAATANKNGRNQIYRVPFLITYMTKLLDSDWLTAEQFSANTVQKRVIVNSMQFIHRILVFD